ncbi:MAG: endonuclease/exonuclease/phosphatase family protein [Pseudomonadota bacterium]
MRAAPLLALMLAACTPPGDTGAPADSGVDTGDSGQAPATATVLSLNLHCLRLDGTEFSTNEERFDVVAEVVAAEGVGLIALQELCEREGESASALLLAALEARTGAAWSLQAAFAHVGWEGTENEADEYVGLAARGELAAARAIAFGVQEGLTRVAVQGRWESSLGPLNVTSVHLDNASASARRGQGRQAAVEGLVGEGSPASLILGDMNAQPGSDVIEDILGMGYRDLAAALGDDRIDHVLAHRGAPVAVAAARRVFTGAEEPVVSDHPGVLVRIEAAEAEEVTLTRLVTDADAALGHFLAVRGDAAPLSWDLGWPAANPEGRWVAAFSEIPSGSFEYKWLRDDVDWQQGENEVGTAGEESSAEPGF